MISKWFRIGCTEEVDNFLYSCKICHLKELVSLSRDGGTTRRFVTTLAIHLLYLPSTCVLVLFSLNKEFVSVQNQYEITITHDETVSKNFPGFTVRKGWNGVCICIHDAAG